MTTCGTDPGWHAHRTRGQDPCAACVRAHAAALAAWEQARARAADSGRQRETVESVMPVSEWDARIGGEHRVPSGRCGTAAGRLRHQWRGETPCVWCQDAWNKFAADARSSAPSEPAMVRKRKSAEKRRRAAATAASN